jgi:hypothetical protein
VRPLPVAEQVVDDGVEPFGRWVPRLEQVVVETDVVDRPDGHVGVGVRRQQQQLGVRGVLSRLTEHLGPAHVRHPLVGGDQGDRPQPQGEFRERGQRLGS